MQPEFYQIGNALRETLAYYKIGRIKLDMDYLAGTSRISSNPPIEESWYNLMFELHTRMEQEINQVIHTCNQNTQVFLFENLKSWLTDWRIKSINREAIYYEIDTYNERAHQDFLTPVENKVSLFRQTPEFLNREHLEEYEEERKPFFCFGMYQPSTKVKKINYKYYCITENPNQIDETYFPHYIKRLTKLIDNLRNILTKYVELYEAGKIVPATSSLVNKSLLSDTTKALLPTPIKESGKIKVNLTVKQLAYLFKLLYETKPDIFKGLSKAELYRFISANFSTKAAEEISIDSLNNHFNTVEHKTAEFWIEYLKKMLQQSRIE